MQDKHARLSNIVSKSETKVTNIILSFSRGFYGVKPNYNVDFLGFLVTCSFKEKDCLREVYQLLNEYSSEPTVTEEQVSEVEDNIDIETELRNQIEQSKKDQQKKVHNFCNVATGVQNLLFVKVASTHLDPVQLGTKIVIICA